MSYTIKFTDKEKAPIIIDDGDIDNTTALTLFGRTRLAYGQDLQANLLHILENFACPENPFVPGTPDKTKASGNMFAVPIEGQFWYNSTQTILYYYSSNQWIPLAREDGVAANWGIISDGEYLPQPVSEVSGKVFSYKESVWIVSPFTFPQQIDFMVCKTDANALVSMQYRIAGTSQVVSGIANYLIVGIAGNIMATPPPQPSMTATPTPTPTTSVGNSATPTPTVTRSGTPVPTNAPSSTPAASISPTPAVSNTPVASPAPQPSNTPVPSPAGTAPIAGLQSANIYAYSVGSAYGGQPTANASVGLALRSDGTYQVGTGGTTVSGNYSGTWLPSGWSVGDSQVQFTAVNTTSDDLPAQSITNTAPSYSSLSSTQSFTIAASEPAAGGRGHGTQSDLTIYLRRASTGQVITTSLSMTADTSSGD